MTLGAAFGSAIGVVYDNIARGVSIGNWDGSWLCCSRKKEQRLGIAYFK
jgi:hypothetical protein